MKRVLIVLFLIATTLCAEDVSLNLQEASSAFDDEPASFVSNVNVTSGTFHHSSIDLTIPGQEALNLQHFYSSDSCFENWMGRAALSTNFPTRIIYTGLKGAHEKHLSQEGPQGSFLHYKSKPGSKNDRKRHYYLAPDAIHKGFTNTGSGELSGRTNLKNSWFYFFGRGESVQDLYGAEIQAGLGDGTYREYHRLYTKGETVANLKHEKRPNGNNLHFTYDHNKDLKSIHLFDRDNSEAFGWLEFSYDGNEKRATVSSSNGKSTTYSFFREKHPLFGSMKYVEKIESSNHPTLEFSYTKLHSKDNNKPRQLLSKIEQPDGRFLKIAYDEKGRVRSQEGPYGRLWDFRYHTHHTEVLDALNRKTFYRFSGKKRLTCIDRYAHKKLLRRERFFWGDESSIHSGYRDASNEGNLIGKALLNSDDKAISSMVYHYDSRGNVLHNTLFGNLTGDGKASFSIDDEGKPTDASVEQFKRQFTYSEKISSDPKELKDVDYNLLLSESENGEMKVAYEYKDKSDLLAAKFTFDKGSIAIREFYDYDKRGTLIKKIVDDGDSHDRENLHHVTERHITKIKPVSDKGCLGACLPETVSEFAYDLEKQREVLLTRCEFRYNTQGQITEERRYDATNKHAYTLFSEYDARGRLISSTDAAHRTSTFCYDNNNNKIAEERTDTGLVTTFAYDKMNRLTEKVEKYADGEKLKESYSYDAVGNKIASIDAFGYETKYEYDDLNRLIRTISPKAHIGKDKTVCYTIERTYDEANNVIAETNQNGATTHTSYNSRKQPIRIRYPDGSEEHFRYNLDSTLKYRKEANGVCHHFEYDYQKRVLKETLRDAAGNYLSSTTNQYNAFHLLSTEDAMHYKTEYSYDIAGRLREVRKEQARVSYEYDSLGRQAVTKDWNGPHRYTKTTREFDALNRITEEREEHDSGTLLRRQTFTYDKRGNQTHISTYSSAKEFSQIETKYDLRNMPIVIKDELGAITSITYDLHFRNARGERVLSKTTTDPLGNQTIEEYDIFNRLVCMSQENKSGECTQRTSIRYDGVGNRIKEAHDSIVNQKTTHRFCVLYKYDRMNHLIEVIEQPKTEQAKKTSYTYSKEGFLTTTTKPDGVELAHTYDALGNLSTLKSSDKTVSYEYTHDKNNNPIRVIDHVHHITHERRYDAHGQVTQDFDITLAYDKRQRLKLLTLPDGSSVRYKYVGGHLSDVVRYSSSNKELYRHSYKAFDLQDHVLKSHLIGNAGLAHFSWDKKGRCIAITTPHWSQELTSIDAAGNIKKMSITDPKGSLDYHFSYDDLYQLKKENDHTYAHDSLFNRLKKDEDHYTLDLSNQLLETDSSDYCYDKNGNLIKKTEKGTTTYFQYDALDRLIEAKQEGTFRACYVYDSLNRRLSKELYSWKHDRWIYAQKLHFLYLAEREIVAMNSEKKLIEFRALGRGKGAEIGATVAIELESGVYAPIHDHRGNISALIDASTGTVAETMHYTAFGEESASEKLSPWRFASKRLDPETGLIYFGQRYYCPETGRWMTPDPAGFTDGPNLYAYVQNNPLTLFDPYGLSSLYDDQMNEHRETNAEAHHSLWHQAMSDANAQLREHNIRCEREKFCSAVHTFMASVHEDARSRQAMNMADSLSEAHLEEQIREYWSRVENFVSDGVEFTDKASTVVMFSGVACCWNPFGEAAIGVGSIGKGSCFVARKVGRVAGPYIRSLALKSATAVQRMFTAQKSTASNSFYRWLGGGHVNLASVKRTGHILFGDAGGGHMWPGQLGKSLFPKHWSGGKIMHYISDIATDPKIQWKQISGRVGAATTYKGRPVRYLASGTREGVSIRVILEPGGEGIITGFPFP